MVGNRTRVKVVKNKMAPPFRSVEFDIMYGEGISRSGDLLDLGVNHNVVDKSGSWFSFQGQRVGQGRENAKLMLSENPDVASEIEKRLLEHFGLTQAESPTVGSEESGEGKKEGPKRKSSKK